MAEKIDKGLFLSHLVLELNADLTLKYTQVTFVVNPPSIFPAYTILFFCMVFYSVLRRL